MRNRFDEQLNQLNNELIAMGSLCEEAIANASKSIKEQNGRTLYENVSIIESAIDQKERDIQSLCMKMLLQQQPVARDLREISSALKMISDMERIGDQASDIVEIARFIKNPGKIAKIEDMARATIKMVTEAIDSFVNKDLELAKSVEEYDDVVDAHFSDIRNDLIELLGKDNKDGEYCIDLLMIAKYFERIGDHATNIAEWVQYSITGKHKDGSVF